jgi:hypothetical protein
MKSSVQWLNREPASPLPYIGLCTTEAQFLDACKHLKFANPPRWITGDNSNGTTHFFTSPKGERVCVVCIRVPKGKKLGEVLGLIVHEAVHVWQEYCDMIGEHRPSSEFEAYTVQAIAQRLMFAYNDKAMEKPA